VRRIALPMASELPPDCIAATSLVGPPGVPFLIVGLTSLGRAFRPSDWADRLAGVMSSFQPPGAAPASRLQYSPYAVPGRHHGTPCVRVDPGIAQIEPMALTFLVNFARDNDLQISLTFDPA
jgi:hypothetical protein